MLGRGKLRVGILVFIVICACGIGLYLWPGQQQGLGGEQPLIHTEQPGGADVSIRQMHLVEMNEDRKEWELEAATADVYNDKGVTFLKDVLITFYPEEPEPIGVKGERATFFNATRDLRIEGSVVVSPIDGYTAYADSVRWVAAEQVITTEDEVRAIRPGSELCGKGMRADARKRQLQIHQSVEAHLNCEVPGQEAR